MGLILCDNTIVNNPLYVSGLGARVYSKEELCYVIYNYPLLVLEGFVDDRFIEFIKNELKISLPSVVLDNEDILFGVLNACDYYSTQEIDHFRLKVSELRKLPKFEFLCEKGDLLFYLKEYGKAIESYTEALEEGKYYKADESFNFRVYKSIGNSYANLLDLEKAFNAYKDALTIKEDTNVLKKIYFISKFEDTLGKKEEYIIYLDDRVDPSWDEEYETVMNNEKESENITVFRNELNQDPIKRRKSLNIILNKWKQGYRNMLH